MIHHVEIKNFKGIRHLNVDVPTGGVIAEGGNGKGKTSLLRAVQAALTGAGLNSDAITVGEDSCTLLVAFDDGTEVRRSLKRGGSPRAEVTVPTEHGRVKVPSPAAWLSQAVGASIDPLALFLAKPSDRREIVLSAMPVVITREELLSWCPDVPVGISLDRHGLDVVGDMHAHYYALRTKANAAADESRRVAAVARGAADAAPGGEDVDLARMEREESAAVSELARMRSARESAERAFADWSRRASQMASAEKAVANAAASRDEARDENEKAHAAIVAAARVFCDAFGSRKGIDVAREALRTAIQHADGASHASAIARDTLARAEEALESLRAAIGEAPARIPDDAVASAESALSVAREALREAQAHSAAARERARLQDAAAAAERRAAADRENADRLDKIVKALAAAPAELIAKSAGIPGLGVSGSSITLDGRVLDDLCGAEQLEFSVEIAKRANASVRHRILVTDGLERLDAEQLARFVALTEGWDVIATRVRPEGGPLSLVPLRTPEAQS